MDDLPHTAAMTMPALLAPTEALRGGFEFDFDDAPAPSQRTAPAGPNATARGGEASGSALQRQGFRIGGLRLMIPYEHGSELIEMPPVYRLPNSPTWFVGMANLHGGLVPVFDLAERFSVEHNAALTPMLLVLGHGDDKAGLVIDGLPERLRPTHADRIEGPALHEALVDCVSGAYWFADQDWMEFNYAALFDRLVLELAQ